MEKDVEVKGEGNSIDFGARMYDSRLNRWLACDPLSHKYPYLSPYNFVANSPLILIDPDGKRIKGVKFNEETGEFTYSAAALKRGTDKYVNARSQTPSGREAVIGLIKDKATYKITVTDEVLVGGFKIDGKKKYSTADGLTIERSMVLSSSMLSNKDLKTAGAPDEEISVVTLNLFGNLKHSTIKRGDIAEAYGNEESKYLQEYNRAVKDSGFDPNDPKNIPRTGEEKLHNTGAHEETHLKEEPGLPVYDAELPAFKASKKATEDYKKVKP